MGNKKISKIGIFKSFYHLGYKTSPVLLSIVNNEQSRLEPVAVRGSDSTQAKHCKENTIYMSNNQLSTNKDPPINSLDDKTPLSMCKYKGKTYYPDPELQGKLQGFGKVA